MGRWAAPVHTYRIERSRCADWYFSILTTSRRSAIACHPDSAGQTRSHGRGQS
ncbi:hypothetical protein NDI38_26020 [Stenomitos frigidus AS-A4]|uniref:Uncharacterized protein n=1 Tax=Stenomitos frigidus AS-A4 TaxID=2933935 RepID=A0ABV0KRG2_9CYAN